VRKIAFQIVPRSNHMLPWQTPTLRIRKLLGDLLYYDIILFIDNSNMSLLGALSIRNHGKKMK